MDLELNGKDTDIHHTGIVCITDSEGNQVSGFRTWSDDECNGVIESFVGEDGEPVTPDSWVAGTCLENTPECAESQEWTYGIDNTGTIYNDVATYSFDLSDGSTLDFAQDGSSTSWSPQLIEWAANVQQAADDAGLSWFVEPRFVTETNLTNGGGGLAGAPSEALGQGLYDGGMRWRYLNIQICAGQPVPTRAYRKTSTTYGDGEFDLTSAGAFLGSITKFKKCHKCGNGADVWYVLDEVAGDGTYREATAGEVPNCAEPCGTLALADAPPDRDCEFIFDVACDNNNSNNTDDFTNTITRRATICNGQQISLNYFEQDPDDASALIDYELQGDFVDCATGELIPVPQGDILINCTDDKVAEEHDIKVQIQGSKNPLPVFIAEKCTDDVSLDTEVLCNEDTDVWEYHVTTVTNGVASNLTITPTTVACDEEQPDFETRTICVNGTEHYQVLQIDEDGAETVLSEVDSTLECPDSEVSCVESQEWTYGIDNTGTTTDEDAVITITLSDGSSFDIQQTNQGAVSQWTPQMGEWGDNIQSAADAAGLAWFVETRCILSSGGLDGCGGFSGPPSVPISEGLWAGGISARYVNIQICAGQPVPVGAVYNSATKTDYTLTTAGAVKGPLQKFFVCRSCGNEPVWYLSDGVTPASSGQIPNCYEPCGTITLADAPPDRDCEFIFDVACDNNNSVNTVNFTNTITRRSTVCNGQQIGLDYFEQDPDDTSSLIEYELVGDFVDCATGEPVDVPPQPCETYELEKFWQLSGVSQGLRNREWTTDLPILDMEDVDATIDFVDTFDYSVVPDVDTVITSNVALLNDTDDTAVVLDYQLREGYIVVDAPVTVRWGASSEGALLVDLGLCGGDLKRVVALASAVGLEYTNSVYLPTGIHYIRMHNVDNAGSNSSWVPQSSNNGIDFVADNDVLDDLSSTTQPNNECLTVKICETSGETYNFLTDEAIDLSILKTCPISCGAADSTINSCLTPTGDVLCHDVGKARQYISCENNSYTYLDTVTGEEVDAGDLVSCEGEYNNFIDQTLCEIDAEYLLLIDSGGKFGRYSFYTGEWTLVDTLSVRSAGGSADVDNFLLYNFIAPDQLTVIDVNTDIQLPNVTLIDGVINPAAATNPKTFSAGAFRKDDGKMYAWDTAGADAGLYSVDVVSGEVDFITTVSGVVGAGTSIMVDNFSDTLYINGSLGRIYQVDWVTGVGTQWGQAPIGANGATFDESGNAYISAGENTYKLPAGLDPMDELNWTPIITDFVYGANSVAYYRVVAAKPSCFNRRYGVNPDGTRELIGDFNVADDSVRTVVGDIDCCSSGGSSSDTGGGIADVFVQNFPASQTVDGTVSVDNFPASQVVEGEVNIGNWPTEVDTPLITEVGVDTNVPAGFKSVTIVSTSGETTINGLYVLGEGRLPSSQSFGTDRGNYINEILPAYTLAGGTWQWIGHK